MRPGLSGDRCGAGYCARLVLQPLLRTGPSVLTSMYAAHVEVPQPAELGADDFLLHDLGRRELQRDDQAGHEVLLDPELRHVEGVPDVLGVHREQDRLVDRDRQGGGDDVVPRGGVVGRVESEEVAARRRRSARGGPCRTSRRARDSGSRRRTAPPGRRSAARSGSGGERKMPPQTLVPTSDSTRISTLTRSVAPMTIGRRAARKDLDRPVVPGVAVAARRTAPAPAARSRRARRRRSSSRRAGGRCRRRGRRCPAAATRCAP